MTVPFFLKKGVQFPGDPSVELFDLPERLLRQSPVAKFLQDKNGSYSLSAAVLLIHNPNRSHQLPLIVFEIEVGEGLRQFLANPF